MTKIADARELVGPELAHELGHQGDDEGRDHEEHEAGRPGSHQTRLTTTRPNSPAGRNSRTPISTAKATGSSSSGVTKST